MPASCATTSLCATPISASDRHLLLEDRHAPPEERHRCRRIVTRYWKEDHRLERFVNLTVNGLSTGAVYAAFALALVLIWRATRVVNFAQGAMAVTAAYVSYSVTNHTHS